MDAQSNAQLLSQLKRELYSLRDDALEMEKRYGDQLERTDPQFRDSATNLLHYLSIRQKDIRSLQQNLASFGLSSLGVLEPHAMTNLNAVIAVLERLTSHPGDDAAAHSPLERVDMVRGPGLLREHASILLGPEPQERPVRIMVTMPSEAADNPTLVESLLRAGMDLMRINCAHDGPEQWQKMVDNLRLAEQKVGRTCHIQADLAGPKLRTGSIRPIGRVLRLKPQRDDFGLVESSAQVWVTSAERPELPDENVEWVLPLSGELSGVAQPGDHITFTDARGKSRTLKVKYSTGMSCLAEIDNTAYVDEGTKVILERPNSKKHDDSKKIAKATVQGLPEIVSPIQLHNGDQLILTRHNEPGNEAQYDETGMLLKPAHIHATLSEAFDQVKVGEHVWFDDGKIGGTVSANDGDAITVEITHAGPNGAKLKAEKGINFPDTDLKVEALTNKDRVDLAQVASMVDIVALSFVRCADDILHFHQALKNLNADHLGVVLKIENRSAFDNLPSILLASMRTGLVGVMVARGDLAVEVGFERLSEVQQEILWICEAAHVPVIWATQILEGMAKKGVPSRSEVSDAGLSINAECAMLNKGPYIVETVRFLCGIIQRMDDHYYKRRATLRKLSVASLRSL